MKVLINLIKDYIIEININNNYNNKTNIVTFNLKTKNCLVQNIFLVVDLGGRSSSLPLTYHMMIDFSFIIY